VLAKSQGYLSLAIRIFKIPQALLTLAMRIYARAFWNILHINQGSG